MVMRSGTLGQHFGCKPGHFGQHFGCKIIKPNGEIFEIEKLCGIQADANLAIRPQVRGATMLQWDLREIREIRSWSTPIETAIDYAHVGVNDAAVGWHELADYAVRGDGVFYIDKQLVFGHEYNAYFRLRLRDSVGNVHTTQPAHSFNDIPRSQTSIYREALRRWLNRQQRQELRIGSLLKQIRWGDRCAECRDRDGGQQIKSQCPNCFDTGFVGGYYRHCDSFGVEASPQQFSDTFKETSFGQDQDGPFSQFFFLNMPQVFPGDVWVDWATDERWVFGSPMVTKQRLGNVELFRAAPVARIPFNDIVYDFQHLP
jgi:hypothetical protein